MTLQTAMIALSQGHSISKVIKSILAMNTPLAKSIKEALKQGYNEDQIGEYLTKGKSQSYSQRNKMLKDMTEEEKGRGILYHQSKSEKNIGNIIKGAAMTAPGLAAGYAAAPIAGAALRRAAPQIFGQGAIPGAAGMAANAPMPPGPTSPGVQVLNPNAPTGNQTQTPGQQTPVTNLQSPQQPPVNESRVTQPTVSPQPEVISNPKEYLEKLGILDRVKSLLKAGNTPEGVAAAIGMKRSGETKIDPELLKNIEEYAKIPEEKANEKFVETEIGQLLEVPKPGSTVASPHGIGEVKAIRNGKAIVEIDGKKLQVDEDELIESPMPEKDLADLYTDLIGGIEKTTGQQVSRNVEWAGYDPNVNELVYKPHGSDKVYVYDNISPEDAQQLTSLMNQRKSTGDNFIGAWEKGTESPIGAGMYQLIKKLQNERGGKGNEYRNRFETIYDALEPAKQAAKKKHAEAKKKAKKSGIA